MIPLFTSSQIREIDEFAINHLGIPSFALMENASISIYHEIINHFPSEQYYSILIGKGNNGGDGLALARHLINDDKFVKLLFVGDPNKLSKDAQINWNILQKYTTTLIEYKVYNSKKDINFIKNSDVIIDALLGTGSKGELKGNYSEIIEEVNKLDCYKVSIDLPSGLNCDSGYGELVFDADLTLTLAEFKKGLFFEKGYLNSGKVLKCSIGISNSFFNKYDVFDYLIEPEDAFDGLPLKNFDIHKYSAGKVLIIGGSFDLPGAPMLAGISALKSGAGAVILAAPYNASLLMTNNYHDLVIKKIGSEESNYFSAENIKQLQENISWADSIVLGPGIGKNKKTKEFVLELLKKNPKKIFIIDADALSLISDQLNSLDLSNCVLTPHQGEFERLTGIKKEDFSKDILHYGKKFAKDNKCLLVLKGMRTIIFNDNSEAFINTAGNPGMAKFGTGDVLSGILGSFISQSRYKESAVISAVYLHSLAADILLEEKTEYGITATDISNNIPNAINFLRNSID